MSSDYNAMKSKIIDYKIRKTNLKIRKQVLRTHD